MNWDAIQNDLETQKVLSHWGKLGRFRSKHPAIGAGIHHVLLEEPFVFSRHFSQDNYSDKVIVGLGLPIGKKTINVSNSFNDNDVLFDAYSRTSGIVYEGKVVIDSQFDIVLLEIKP
jgi:alpha-amylase